MYRSPIIAAVVIIVATFLPYWPALRNSFVWDDTALVLRDPLIRHWRLLPEVPSEFLFLDATASDFYRPLQRATYTADYALWGIAREGSERTNAPDTGDAADTRAVLATPQPGWHFTSILLHALAALALWRLLLAWLGEGGKNFALAGALLWAVHPLHTSAVTYVSGRADSLAALFVFSALALVARAHAGGGLAAGDRVAAKRIIGAAACALLALLSKEAGVAALGLWLVWLLVQARGSGRAWVAFAVSALVVCGAYFSLRSSAASTPAPPPRETTPALVRPILATRAVAEYSALFAFPHSLHMERDISTKPQANEAETLRWARLREWQTLAGVALLGGFCAWALWARRRAPGAALALGLAAVAWLPVSNLFTLNATVAEHWLYVPSAFLLAALLFTARALAWRWVPVAAALWALFLAVQTWQQQGYWRDQRTFFTETLARAGQNSRMLGNLAGLEFTSGNAARGRELLAAALELDPESPNAHSILGTLALVDGDLPLAETSLALLKKSPHMQAESFILAAKIEKAKTGKPQFDELSAASNAARRNWAIQRQLPLALEEAGKPHKAYEDILRSVNTQPWRSEAWRMLAGLAEKMRQHEPALRAYGEAANRDCRDEFSRERLRALSAGR